MQDADHNVVLWLIYYQLLDFDNRTYYIDIEIMDSDNLYRV